MTVLDGGPADSRSGAGVRRARLPSGELAYLKTTPASLESSALDAARRELRFYRDVAPDLAVPTPELLAWRDTGDGVALLLASAGDPVPVRQWTPRMWAALGDVIAVLHDAPGAWPRPDPLAGPHDIGYWRGLPSIPIAELAAAMALPPVFGHGDCHAANVVWRDGRPVVCDWQMAGIGRPGSDLAFPGVRAAPDGVVVPPELMAAYVRRRRCDEGALRRAVLAEELAFLLYVWPPYATLHTGTAIGRVRDRIRTLVRRWERQV